MGKLSEAVQAGPARHHLGDELLPRLNELKAQIARLQYELDICRDAGRHFSSQAEERDAWAKLWKRAAKRWWDKADDWRRLYEDALERF